MVDEDQPEVMFDGSGSRVRFGAVTDYNWDFGDSTSSLGGGVSPTHRYREDGPAQYLVTLTVTDNRGRTDSASTQVTVSNLPPAVNANTSGAPYTCRANETIQLSGECDDPSPIDDQTLSCTWADYRC